MSRRYDDFEDDYDDFDDDEFDRSIRRGRRRGSGLRPGKVHAIAIMTLIGGIWACLWAIHIGVWMAFFGLGTCGVTCLNPGPYYSLVLGILAIVKGSQLLGENAAMHPPPRGISIMMIINIINADVVNCVLGILNLVFCGDPEVEGWYDA
jgi:hypothetical protein